MTTQERWSEELLEVLNRYQPTDAVPGLLDFVKGLALVVALGGPVLDDEDSSGFFRQLEEMTSTSGGRKRLSPVRQRCSEDFLRVFRLLMIEAQSKFLELGARNQNPPR